MTTTSNANDIFVSYSHSDRQLVDRFAGTLRSRGVRLWLDEWEMRPGDLLRERVLQGIREASHFLVVLSPTSLRSNWVRYELNSGMIDEIEQGNVRVIPAIAPGADFPMLPADLRAKYCLDLRTDESFLRSVDKLVDLIRPDKRMRRELLQRLNSPESQDSSTTRFLVEHATGYGDQRIQIAALNGLASILKPAALTGIAIRAFDNWGMEAIRHSLKLLAQRHADGGLLVLTASLPIDHRFLVEKFQFIAAALRSSELRHAQQLAQFVSRSLIESNEPSDALAGVVREFEGCDIPDLRYGAVLCRASDKSSRLAHLPALTPDAVEMAKKYSDFRVPGLAELVLNFGPEHYVLRNEVQDRTLNQLDEE